MPPKYRTPSLERRDMYEEPLTVKDHVLFSYHGKLTEAVVEDLHASITLPLILLSSLDGQQQTRVLDKEVCKIHLEG